MARTVYLTPAEVAEKLHVSEDLLRNWRYLGRGPQFKKFGRLVRYPLAAVEAYEEAA